MTYTQDGVQKEKYTLSYDGQGYILSETYTDSYKDAFAGEETTTSQTYTYDAIGRLTQSKTERAGKEKMFPSNMTKQETESKRYWNRIWRMAMYPIHAIIHTIT